MVVVGKDVLELLSSAMYVDPLTIYREYVQNSADAVDEARTAGLLRGGVGRVHFDIDAARRIVRIRDNGCGIPIDAAPERLLSIGASVKRGTRARGFRGVGRLAGLAYCRQLTFRTRSAGDSEVLELTWDCQQLKAALRDVAQSDDLRSVINRIVTLRRLPGQEYPSHFFEVELADVLRRPKDTLLNAPIISAYLAQVAPVPFHPDFRWGEQITAHLREHGQISDLQITLQDAPPLTRPHRDEVPVSDTALDRFTALELLKFDGMSGDVAGAGWVLHHGYLGALPDRAQIKGLRIRVGNVQVGDEVVAQQAFPEARFNSWTVGEIHVLDPRILPNARRDQFEHNVHYENLMAQLEPLGRAIARKCRTASIERNRVRRLSQEAHALTGELVSEASQGVAPSLLARFSRCVVEMKRVAKLFGENAAAYALLAELEALQAALDPTSLPGMSTAGSSIRE